MFTVLHSASLPGRRKPIARAIGATAIKVNRYDSEPGQAGFAHNELESGQEEIYIPVEGDGVLHVGGEDVLLAPGLFVLAAPDETRQVIAGAAGCSYIVVGAVANPDEESSGHGQR
jgi:uncharacterized cupin superfamily protein